MGFFYALGRVRMTGFRGRAHIKLDPKGRLSLPATFRASVGNVNTKTSSRPNILMATNSVYKGLPFLDLLTRNEWQKLELKIAQLSSLKSEAQVFQRFYLSSGEACELDTQSRILLPQHLREYAKLQESIVLVGMGNKIEIWSEKNWQTIFLQLKTDYETVLQELATLDATPNKNEKKK